MYEKLTCNQHLEPEEQHDLADPGRIPETLFDVIQDEAARDHAKLLHQQYGTPMVAWILHPDSGADPDAWEPGFLSQYEGSFDDVEHFIDYRLGNIDLRAHLDNLALELRIPEEWVKLDEEAVKNDLLADTELIPLDGRVHAFEIPTHATQAATPATPDGNGQSEEVR